MTNILVCLVCAMSRVFGTCQQFVARTGQRMLAVTGLPKPESGTRTDASGYPLRS